MPLTSDHIHAAAVVAAELIPVPLVDTLVQNQVRRNLVRTVARAGGLRLPADTVAHMADEPLRPVWRVLTWPFRKLLRVVIPPVALYLAYREVQATLALAERVRAGLADEEPSVTLLPQTPMGSSGGVEALATPEDSTEAPPEAEAEPPVEAPPTGAADRSSSE